MLDVVYISIVPLLFGYIFDLLLGDPNGWPHPIRWFGGMISWIEKKWNHGKNRRLKGGVVAFSYPLFVLVSGILIQTIALSLNKWLYCFIAGVFVYYGLANRCLIHEGHEVIRTLENNGLEAGRKRLSWIVGRDTSELSSKEIYTAVFETMSENLSDGVVAPLFFYALGGFPAMLAYKMVNTLDSMIGYRDEKYLHFGCCAARLDDVLNYIPARLTALLIACVTFKKGIFSFIRENGHRHASPNAGFPESAMAFVLDCRFGGTHVYHGMKVVKPYIGNNDREFSYEDFITVASVNHRVTLLAVLLICMAEGFFYCC